MFQFSFKSFNGLTFGDIPRQTVTQFRFCSAENSVADSYETGSRNL